MTKKVSKRKRDEKIEEEPLLPPSQKLEEPSTKKVYITYISLVLLNFIKTIWWNDLQSRCNFSANAMYEFWNFLNFLYPLDPIEDILKLLDGKNGKKELKNWHTGEMDQQTARISIRHTRYQSQASTSHGRHKDADASSSSRV